jgi:Holliday junction resolvasome RuvABC endonuclease subunit
MPHILGLDLSLTGTGRCRLSVAHDPIVQTTKTKFTGHERLQWIIDTTGIHSKLDLVVLEGPAYSRQAGQAGHHERAGLWWLIAHRLWLARIPYAVVPPNVRAKYATGKGNAGKDEVLASVIKRYGHLVDVADNNQADALILAAMGAHHLGAPLVDVPKLNATALEAAKWPELPSDGEPVCVADVGDINPYEAD